MPYVICYTCKILVRITMSTHEVIQTYLYVKTEVICTRMFGCLNRVLADMRLAADGGVS